MKKKTTKELEKSMKEIIEIEEKRQDLRIELTNLIQNKIVNNFKDAEGNNCLYEVTIKGKKQMQSLEDLWIAFQELPKVLKPLSTFLMRSGGNSRRLI